MKKRILTCLLVAPAATLAAIYAAKLTLEHAADDASRTIIDRIGKSTAEETFLKKTTAFVHGSLTSNLSSGEMPLLMRLRPYLTHRFVPVPLRLRDGAIDVIYLDQTCDNAARAMSFILRQAGFTANQFNIVGPSQAHTIVQADLSDGRDVILDPHFGVVAEWDNRLIGAKRARQLLQNGRKPEEVWHRLGPESFVHSVHKQFSEVKFAAQGERLELVSDIRLDDGEILQLGAQDGLGGEVSDAGIKAGLTAYWHYIGSRYDRGWVRGLRFYQPTRVTIGLTERPINRLITSNKQPKVNRRKLIYKVSRGETLLFTDGKAGFDWLRLRSYQDVDYVRFEALKNDRN